MVFVVTLCILMNPTSNSLKGKLSGASCYVRISDVLTKFESLISSGNAIPYTAHAASPTITMPRIKAVTTGSVPSFLDVILNFVESDTSSNLANQDTWLSQIKARGGRLVFYGDDTWLKLFPDFFDRADGTSSFFVSVGEHAVTRTTTCNKTTRGKMK